MTGVGNTAPPDHGDVQDRGRHRHPTGPYKGDAGDFPALITGEIQVAIAPWRQRCRMSPRNAARAGVAGAKRSAALPECPRRRDRPRPASNPRAARLVRARQHTGEVVNAITRAPKTALVRPDVLERLRVTGNEALGSTPAEFEQRFKARPREICQDREGRPYSCTGLSLSGKSGLFCCCPATALLPNAWSMILAA